MPLRSRRLARNSPVKLLMARTRKVTAVKNKVEKTASVVRRAADGDDSGCQRASSTVPGRAGQRAPIIKKIVTIIQTMR